MFPRVTHPSATPGLPRAFDLHVLSLPPAFALSQDQTLRLDENLKPAGHVTFDEVHHDVLPQLALRSNAVCTFYENVYRRSLFRPRLLQIALRGDTARKDHAVHVSLSSDSLVKQPGPREVPTPYGERRRAIEARPPSRSGGWFTEVIDD
jgi:hypothetical protein